jgi:3-methylcrotonyl-CoA carboxylase alpha subunit
VAEYALTRPDGRTVTAYATASPQGLWVFIEGDTFLVEDTLPAAAPRGRATADEAALAAPMPASVVAVNVADGDAVAAGDVLILLEAMKMELPIKAPRSGTVAAIRCREGDLVQPGVPLIDLT